VTPEALAAYVRTYSEPAAIHAVCEDYRAAAGIDARPLLKLELGGDGDVERVRAVRQAAPTARLIVDANEGWNEAQLGEYMPILVDLRVALIGQPLADDALARLERPIPLCADESCRTLAYLDRLEGKYQAINIKLDKVDGLTEALALAEEAKRRGLRIMVGGVSSTSLGIAPALPQVGEASRPVLWQVCVLRPSNGRAG
jgi:L-Ala-D/L-Glu epimerase